MAKGKKMILISVHIPKQALEELDELVRQGVFPSRSEAIRIAIRDLLYKERSQKGVDVVEGIVVGR
jgi:Arc/MetJ-type ribon-helix-helix transcriptional regulator